jgi:hypothetical protein
MGTLSEDLDRYSEDLNQAISAGDFLRGIKVLIQDMGGEVSRWATLIVFAYKGTLFAQAFFPPAIIGHGFITSYLIPQLIRCVLIKYPQLPKKDRESVAKVLSIFVKGFDVAEKFLEDVDSDDLDESILDDLADILDDVSGTIPNADDDDKNEDDEWINPLNKLAAFLISSPSEENYRDYDDFDRPDPYLAERRQCWHEKMDRLESRFRCEHKDHDDDFDGDFNEDEDQGEKYILYHSIDADADNTPHCLYSDGSLLFHVTGYGTENEEEDDDVRRPVIIRDLENGSIQKKVEIPCDNFFCAIRPSSSQRLLLGLDCSYNVGVWSLITGNHLFRLIETNYVQEYKPIVDNNFWSMFTWDKSDDFDNPKPVYKIPLIETNPKKDIAMVIADERVSLWSLRSGDEIISWKANLYDAVFSAEGREIISLNVVDDTEDIDSIIIYDLDGNVINKAEVPFRECMFAIPSDSKRFFTADVNRIIEWNSKTLRHKSCWEAFLGSIESVAISSDGTKLATSSYNIVKIWDLSNGNSRIQRIKKMSSVNYLCFSHDAKTLVIGRVRTEKDGYYDHPFVHVYQLITNPPNKKIRNRNSKDRNAANSTIYVGNLPPNFEEDDLRQIFAEYGDILEINIPKRSRNGNFYSFGFVKMAQEEDAVYAVQDLDCYVIEGRIIKVEFAKP